MADPLAAQIEDLTVGQTSWRAIGEIVERHQVSELAVRDLRFGRGSQPLVHGAALVGFDVTEATKALAVAGVLAVAAIAIATHQLQRRLRVSG